jgi:APA family basic amino acid/polyamine antiporter
MKQKPEVRPDDHSAEARRSNVGLLPSLGLFTTTMIVVGAVIGSGIFRKPGVMAGDLVSHGVGSPELLLGVWALAGLITLFGALTNAEIAGMIPETGGQYVYFDRMYGAFPAYIYGWAVFGVIQTGSIASIAYVFAEYFTQFVNLPHLSKAAEEFAIHLPFIGDINPLADIGVKGTAAALIILLTAINYLGVKFGGLVQNIFTVSKIGAMIALVAMAFLTPGVGSGANIVTASTAVVTEHGGGLTIALAIAAALQGAFWAYDGWNNVTYIAGEVRRPQRTIPRALILGMTIIIVVYLLINLAYCYVLPIDQMAQSKLVAADVAERFFSGGGKWIAAAVLISTFGTTNGTILASARVYFSMSRRNVFPRFLGNAHPRLHTPAASLVVQGIWSVMLLFSGTFDTLTDTLIFVTWIFYAAGAFGIFVLRRKEPDTPRPYRVPGYPIIPIVFVLFAVTYLALTVYNDVESYQGVIKARETAAAAAQQAGQSQQEAIQAEERAASGVEGASMSGKLALTAGREAVVASREAAIAGRATALAQNAKDAEEHAKRAGEQAERAERLASNAGEYATEAKAESPIEQQSAAAAVELAGTARNVAAVARKAADAGVAVAGKSAIINSAFGLLLVAIGLPFYFYFRSRNRKGGQ